MATTGGSIPAGVGGAGVEDLAAGGPDISIAALADET